MQTMAQNPGLSFVLIAALVVAGLIVLSQLSPPCTDWRAWKESKKGPGRNTLELRPRPFFCIGANYP